jgi:decaprenylphospho-beta-D-ribofuranose 2-oxidase
VAGSFARHLRSADILLPGGELRTVTEQSDPGLFWATAGGMGLTGLIVRAVIQLTRVGTSRVKVDTVRTADIDETMAVLARHDQVFGYTVAWSDSLARGSRLGRSVVTSGDFAEPGDLPPGTDRFAFDPRARLAAPPWMPPGLINRYSVGLANEAYYRKAPRARQGELQTIGQFFHPLDAIRDWNRVYGHGGFRQYQYVVPFGQEAAVRRSFELVSRFRAASFVTVLKRFGEGNPGLLSFPVPGWTLALDVPARTRGLEDLLGSLDRLVVKAGGRVYLAKDSRVRPAALAEMYPRLPDFRKLRADLDPDGILASDLSRRLAL